MKNTFIVMRSLVLLFYWLISSTAFSATVVETTIDLLDVFGLNADLENGIKGTVNANGRIDVKIYEKNFNVLVYHAHIISTSNQYSGISTNYSKSSLGVGATYYPVTWNSMDFKTALGSVDRKMYDTSTEHPYHYLAGQLSLRIEISEVNAKMETCKIPGLGILDRLGGNPLFAPSHFCHDLKNKNHIATKAWIAMKTPDINKPIDLAIAAHRGIWGDSLGASCPENSPEAIKRTKDYTDILESDIMITKDKQLIVSHDYNMQRISDYSGSNRDYLFNLNSSALDNLHLRKRNMDVSNFRYLKFGDLIDEIIKNQLVLTIDIKDIRARYENGQCVDNCEYDPATAGDEARQKIEESWMDIFKGCIKVASEKGALQYIAFKVPHTYELLAKYVSEDTLSQVLFMPVIQPGRTDYLDFTDAWINSGVQRIIAFETNFKPLSDQALQPITRDGITYQNFLHYVYDRTGLRPGCYPEEPMGPKGIVNRWADWLIKDLRGDIRGDHYLLMTIPYAKIMVLTTDRPDIWQRMTEIYNNISK